METNMSIKRIGLAACLLAGTAVQAQTCESISAEIEMKIRASSGSGNFRLATVDATEPATGRVVGTCGRGTKKIVYSVPAGGAGAASAAPGTGAAVARAQPAKPRSAAKPTDNILTECKDGSMAVGATCGR
jgi:Protein of unknown function (DUF1161)